MPELSKDVVSLLQYLLPGFLVAWVFYGLTSHQKPSQFERVVQALIFSIGVQIVIFFERWLLEFIGTWKSIGYWTTNSDLIASFVTALLVGIAIAYIAEKDILHGTLRRFNLSSRSSHISEWYMAFTRQPRFIVIHFADERRLYGWPKIWPSDSEKGHFLIEQPEWLDVEGSGDNLPEYLLVNVGEVKWIEFIKPPTQES
jgi:hypothetical protein